MEAEKVVLGVDLAAMHQMVKKIWSGASDLRMEMVAVGLETVAHVAENNSCLSNLDLSIWHKDILLKH